MQNHWQTIKSEVRASNPWWTYMVNVFKTHKGVEGEYHIVKTRGASMVVPVLPDGRVVIIKQYRYIPDRDSWEFPCGQLKEHENFEECARAELEEETGYRAGELINIGEFLPYNGVVNEWCRLFLAKNLEEGKAHPESTEEIEVSTRRIDEIDRMIHSGEIFDGQTLAAWSLMRPHLFS
ncbi:MAG: hypothetical protein UX20_C0002G0011 [Candidatus Magasanikbacteria bacterium GW2011_GWC2_45_8]|uniref:Nudix hydrolase domain-containing protein n=2 Tax=Candidatus Magasanikiibacteriota TaxID=1752731 RepID=A0A0G1N1A6_9BACT|nr:MAG: hypothetical protein UX20_C0002G0011 [Candidatus Magasanikbacteria bacterium GW2011_GWC2_45_8]HBW74000.1 hypothetical protein [Candidatus Magasanikbacteria bacterium]